MQFIEPQVELIASTQVETDALQRYLDDIGAGEFELNAPSDAEQLVTIAGKACYKSFVPGLNPNVAKTRSDNKSYITNINKIGHGSVIEHPVVTFVFWNVSRVMTHEIIRHRAGTAMSQESLRYVRLTDLGFWIPKILSGNLEGVQLIVDTVTKLEEVQKELARIYDVDNISSFAEKKKLTSAFRRVAPIGLGTAIIFSMNLRSARHIIQMRTSRHAEEEIRLVFDKVGQILKDKYPNMFDDFYREEFDGYGEWKTNFCATPYDADQTKDKDKYIKELENKIKELEDENRGLQPDHQSVKSCRH